MANLCNTCKGKCCTYKVNDDWFDVEHGDERAQEHDCPSCSNGQNPNRSRKSTKGIPQDPLVMTEAEAARERALFAKQYPKVMEYFEQHKGDVD